MQGLPMIDVAIGLIFIYLILSLVCTSIMEGLAGGTDWRRKNLEKGLMNLFGDKGMVKRFFDHPLIKALKEDGTPPSYIPSKTFAAALIDLLVPTVIVAPGATDPKIPTFVVAAAYPTVAELREAITKLPNNDLRVTLALLLNEAVTEGKTLSAVIETWFNNGMERTSAWYKQKTQRLVFLFAFILTVSINADTIEIAQQLYTNPSLRQALVAQAQEYAKKNPSPPQTGTPEKSSPAPAVDLDSIQKLEGLGLKLGWNNYSSCLFNNKSKQKTYSSCSVVKKPVQINHSSSSADSKTKQPKSHPCWWIFLAKFVGLLITTLAISQGSPFWFDMLNKIISIRGVGKSPEEKAAKK